MKSSTARYYAWREANKEQRLAYEKEYRAKNKEAIKEYKQETRERNNANAVIWRKNNPARRMLHDVKAKAKRLGMQFDLELADIVIPKKCPVLGIPLKQSLDYKTPNSPSLDRFDNTKGYTKDNVRVISDRANTLKRDGTLAEFEAIVAYLKGEK